jgi:mono/diheme cytochrome c family protein
MLSQPSIVPRRQRIKELILAIVLIAVGVVFFRIAGTLASNQPVVYEDIEEHFKYGSIGSEPGGSLLRPIGGALPPYMVFKTLPQMCSEMLPGGYAGAGFIFEPGRDLPIGVSRRRRFGVEQVGFNCALCHTSTVRDSPSAPRRLILGMPAQQLDLQAVVRFILECSLDGRVTAENIRGRFEASGQRLPLFERLLLRVGLVERLKVQTLELRNRMQPSLGQNLPDWGRGRVDTFNPYKAVQFNWPLAKLPQAELIGASDFPSLWNQAPREGLQLHWDGDNDSVDERNLSAALGAGVTPVTVDHDSIKRIRDWIWTLPPPEYPYPVDRDLAARGAEIYRQQCVNCHAGAGFRKGTRDAGRVGFVVPIEEIGTDPHRLNSYTEAFAANQYSLYPESRYRFTHFRKTNGYATHPLDGIWLRGPYLHNGSVPTLRDLLEPPERRPKTFYRGYDVFDQRKVGFVSDVPEEGGHRFTLFDTSLPGNSNSGHLYGTTLSDAEKSALVEYLKVF